MVSIEQELAQLRLEFLHNGVRRVGELRAALIAMEAQGSSSDKETVFRHLHAFAGLGTTHGLPALTELGKEGEVICGAWLQTNAEVDANEIARIHSLVDSIENVLRNQIAETSGPNETPRLLLMEPDPDRAARIASIVESAGYEVFICTDPRRLAKDRSELAPGIVLVSSANLANAGPVSDNARTVIIDPLHSGSPVRDAATVRCTDEPREILLALKLVAA